MKSTPTMMTNPIERLEANPWKVLWSDKIFLLLVLLVAVGVRLVLLVASDWSVDSDEAIVGLMAKHITEGRGIPIFYYGQHYMGSLEPLFVSVMFLLFGGPSPVLLKIVPLFFLIALLPITYLLGYVVGNRRVAQIASVLLAFAPASFIEWSTKARGGFIEIVFLSTLCLYLTLRWSQSLFSWRSTFILGVLLGLGWWTNNQIIFAMIPIGIYLSLQIFLEKDKLCRTKCFHWSQHFISGGSGFLLGGFPFWLYNLQNKFVSFEMFGGSANILENLFGFFEHALPIVFGAKLFWHTDELFLGSTLLSFLLFGGILLAALLALCNHRREVFAFYYNSYRGIFLLLLFIVGTFTIFIVSSFGSLVTAPRYLLPVYPPLYILAGYIVHEWHRVSRILAALLLAGIVFLHWASSYLGGYTVPGEPFVYEHERAQSNHAELYQWLRTNGISWIETNYWIGYKVAFETNEQVRFLMFGDPFQVRIKEYEIDGEEVDPSEVPMVLTPAHGALVASALRAVGYQYQDQTLSGYRVLSHIHPSQSQLHAIPLTDIHAHASLHEDTASSAIDSNVQTRWGTGHSQEPGQTFTLQLNASRSLRGLELRLGKWSSDYPRGLQIQCLNGGQTTMLLSDKQYLNIENTIGGRSLKLYFAPIQCSEIKFTQVGSHPILDWSIAEIRVYE